MKVSGFVTKTEFVKVDIEPIEVIGNLMDSWLKSLDLPKGAFPSPKGWLIWSDTGHGSGLTEEIGRVATDEEQEIYNSFAKVCSIAGKLQEDK